MAPLASRSLIAAALAAAALAASGCGEDEAPATSAAPPSTDTVRVGGTPVAVAVAEGGVWVADNTRASVAQIDPATDEVASRTRVGDGPLALAAGEGAAWAASGDGSISRIDPESGDARTVARVQDPRGIAAGAGSVWVTSGAHGTVTRLDSASGEPVGEPIAVGEDPADVVVSPEAVWVANTADGTVTRIDPESGEATPITAGARIFALAYGEGAVWAATTDDRLNRSIEVVRIDPESGELEGEPVAIDAAIPVRLAAGEGAVWATEAGGVRPPGRERPAAVVRIDPSALETAGEPVRVGESPAGVATGEGAAWVASAGDGTVTKLEPR
jgi:streptogramin lyase